jgi:flagellar motor switch protein FliN
MKSTFSETLPDLPSEQSALRGDHHAPRHDKAVGSSIMKIPVSVQVVIGSTRIPLSQISELAAGSMITLDQKLGAPASVLVNGREVAKGDVFVLDGDSQELGITILEIVENNDQSDR